MGYILSKSTLLIVEELSGASYKFSDDGHQKNLGISTVKNMWTNSLHRTVAFEFRNVQWFHLQVQMGKTHAHKQTMEFAGWSEIVKVGETHVVPASINAMDKFVTGKVRLRRNTEAWRLNSTFSVLLIAASVATVAGCACRGNTRRIKARQIRQSLENVGAE